jgi:Zn-dependent peptidase ImmA (M78 family)
MSRSVQALVKPELLVWARKSAGLTLDRAEKLTGIDSFMLGEWECGRDLPSLASLRKLGEAYKRPLAVFFLAEPPLKFDAQREFRRLAGVRLDKATPELLQALRWAVFRREAAMELHRLNGDQPQRLHAVLHPAQDSEEAGEQIRELLGITDAVQMGWAGDYATLNAWRAAIESKDVLVFQTSDVELREMRATCIPDQPLPVVLLNSQDAPYGRVFSLLHEFSHILLHAGGHQTTRMVGEQFPEEQPLEVAANSFAAAALLPKTLVTKLAKAYPGAASGDEETLRALSQKVNTSPEVILRRMLMLGFASEKVYRIKRDGWLALGKRAKERSHGGPGIDVKTISKDGPGYTRLVLDAFDQRLISTNAASDYLGVKPRHFSNIRRELTHRPTLFGP